ncbi:MAG: formate dehydrogenase [Noviherbaspirillum sp.]|nr:formate dehydrogenase [Noviherbaspirillum sp.]
MNRHDARIEEVDATRRKFLRAARGAGAIGAVAALMGRGAIAEAATVAIPATPEPAGSGYRETEHIRNYYRCARYW